MVAITHSRSLRIPPAIGAAGVAALFAATAIALAPDTWRGTAAEAAGLSSAFGIAAGVVLGAAAALVMGAVAWSLVVVLVGESTTMIRREGISLRRADAHPDAPVRVPIRAIEELGEPLPPPSAPRGIPTDLDTPLAAIDPTSMPDVPREPVRALPSLARPQLIDAGDRFETFDLSSLLRTPRAERVEREARSAPPSPAQSIASLLERLEQSAAGTNVANVAHAARLVAG